MICKNVIKGKKYVTMINISNRKKGQTVGTVVTITNTKLRGVGVLVESVE